MSTIIAGRFDLQDQVRGAASALMDAGFDEDRISSFYLGPAGRHDLATFGGDRPISDGAEHTGRGVVAGSAIGGVVGAATAPLSGPIGAASGALVGAHLGSLIGSLSQTDDADHSYPIRSSGMLIAIEVPDASIEPKAIEILRALGAQDLERAEGTIEEGDWQDFDPSSSPQLLEPEQRH